MPSLDQGWWSPSPICLLHDAAPCPCYAALMLPLSHPFRFLLLALVGWINQQQHEVIDWKKRSQRRRNHRHQIHSSHVLSVLPLFLTRAGAAIHD